MPAIETARLVLRRFVAADAAAMRAVLGDADVMAFSEDGALSHGRVAAWVAQAAGERAEIASGGCWAVTLRAGPDVPIGYASLRHGGPCLPGELELGYRLAKGSWGRGYATEAAAALLSAASSQARSGWAIAAIDPGNAPSIRVAERLGMALVRTYQPEGYDHPDLVYAVSLARRS